MTEFTTIPVVENTIKKETNDKDEIKLLKKQMRDMKMIMLRMEKQMKQMEKLIVTKFDSLEDKQKKYIENTVVQQDIQSPTQTIAKQQSFDISDIHDDNVGFLNKKYKLYNATITSIQEKVKDVVKVSQQDIIRILNEDIEMTEYIIDFLVELNSCQKFIHAFPRDRCRIYEYRFDDDVWYEMKNKDIVQLAKRIESEILNQYTHYISTDDNFMNKIFDKMGNMYKHDLNKNITKIRKNLVEKLVIY